MRTGAFGDILMGTPLLAALRQAYPEAHLTWIAEHSHTQAIDANPYVDEIIRWDGAYWKRMLRRGLYGPALTFGGALRARRYDVFISFQPEEWPLLTLAAGAQTRIGVFDTFRRFYGESRNLLYRHLYTHSYAEPGLPTHRADQYLLPLEALGIQPAPGHRKDLKMSMGFTQEDTRVAERHLQWQGLSPGETFAVLVPGTTWPTKSWPAGRYAALADTLAREHGWRIVLLGGHEERDEIEGLGAQMRTRPVTITGTLTFRQSASLVSRAALLVSGDTGPMHMAAALGTPQIALFGPTAPEWYGPRGGRAVALARPIPCGPCDKPQCSVVGDGHLRCQTGIGSGDVLEAISTLVPTASALA